MTKNRDMDPGLRRDVDIVDVSARDGLQNEPNAALLSADTKVEYLALLAEAGLKRIEAGSFVRPASVPAMENSGEVAQKLEPVRRAHPDVIFSYLVPNLKGLERARAAEAQEVAVFLAVSEAFSRANINASVEESFRAIQPVIAQALSYGMKVRGYLSAIFGYSDMAFSPDIVAQRARQLLEMGCHEASLGDTTGIGTKAQVEALIVALKAHGIALERVAMHFHDTFGNAIGNVDAAYDMGIRVFDASTGGLGGCPYAHSPKGNLAMEDLVAWHKRRGLACAVNSAKLAKAAAFIREKIGKA